MFDSGPFMRPTWFGTVWIGLDLFNDDTGPSGHISRPGSGQSRVMMHRLDYALWLLQMAWIQIADSPSITAVLIFLTIVYGHVNKITQYVYITSNLSQAINNSWLRQFGRSRPIPFFVIGRSIVSQPHHPTNGLVQDSSNSSANVLELLQSCTKILMT